MEIFFKWLRVETEADILLKSTSKELYFDLDDRSVVEFSFPPIKKNLVNFFFQNHVLLASPYHLRLWIKVSEEFLKYLFFPLLLSEEFFFIDFVDCLQGRTTICRFFNYAS